jgi:ribosomal protein L3 glutamine methyltransferase
MTSYAVPNNMQTLLDVLRWCVTKMNQSDVYFGHGTSNSYDESRWMIHHVLAISDVLTNEYDHCRLSEEEKDHIGELLQKRISQRIPLAYLLGEAQFAGLDFLVDERVLIPRSPIAEMIEQQFSPWLSAEAKNILDLCAGSGCIGIACAYAFPQSQVDLADISLPALEVANANIQRHELSDRVVAKESDCFSGLGDKKYDLIVSNPPYVDHDIMSNLPAEYRHEPRLALEAGEEGLDLVLAILKQAAEHLTDHGLLVVEVGAAEGNLLQSAPSLPFLWLEFERGGEGVFLLTRDQLLTDPVEDGLLTS